MLVTSRQDDCSNNLHNNNNNVTLSPHHHRHYHHLGDNGNSLNCHLTEQILTEAGKRYSPRPGHKLKLPPHINICPPDETTHQRDDFSQKEELDNCQYQSPSASHTSTPGSDEKHEIFSGRLYIIPHAGSGCGTSSSPTRSPSTSPLRSTATTSPFRFTPPLSSQQRSPQGSPAASSNTTNVRKMPVFVRVYRCNMDHFAVVTRDILYTSRPVYVNLRHCRVIPGSSLGRFIVAGSCDSGSVIEFESPDLTLLGQWLDAFQVQTPPASPNRMIGGSGSAVSASTPPIPRSPALPTLTETDEED